MSEADCFRYLKSWKQKMARARGREQKQQGRLKIVPKLRNHPPTFVEQDMNDSISFLSETEMAPHPPPKKKKEGHLPTAKEILSCYKFNTPLMPDIKDNIRQLKVRNNLTEQAVESVRDIIVQSAIVTQQKTKALFDTYDNKNKEVNLENEILHLQQKLRGGGVIEMQDLENLRTSTQGLGAIYPENVRNWATSELTTMAALPKKCSTIMEPRNPVLSARNNSIIYFFELTLTNLTFTLSCIFASSFLFIHCNWGGEGALQVY